MTSSTVYRFGVRFEGNAAGLVRAAKEAETALKQSGARSQTEYRRMAEARQVLGVRAERDIQREIQKTEAAYNRMARAGFQSWQEQRQAARAMREEVTKLTNEMGRLTTRQKVAMGARGVAAIAGGAAVATAYLAPKVQRVMSYDQRLAGMANTAYADRDLAGRRRGMGELDRMLVDAVRHGGGTSDNAAMTAEQLLGAGIFKPEEVQTILRQAVRAGTANSTDSGAFAQMAISARQTLGIRPDRMGAMFGMGTYAGQQGGFEIKDMAKWLPQQMAAAKAVGMSGEQGFAKLAALNQAAVVTAGSRDEAGNNVVNLLAKLASPDTIRDFDKKGRTDLSGELARGRMRGLDAIDVLGNVLQQQLAKDPNYRNVQKQLAGAKNDQERQAALQSVGGIAQGTVIGKFFQDRQALMALYGFMQNRDRVDAITRGAMQNPDAAERNFDLISSTSSFKVQQAKNEAEFAQYNSISKLTPAIDTLADKTAALIREYPGFTTAMGVATTALIALAGSAATAAVLNGGKLGGLGAGALGGALGTAGRFGGAGLAGLAGYGIGTLAYKGLLEGNAGGDLVGRGIAGTLGFFGNKDAQEALRAEGAGARSASERLGSATGALPLLQQDLRGEIMVTVSGAPGLNVQAETRTNSPRIPFRTDTGRTNLNAGF